MSQIIDFPINKNDAFVYLDEVTRSFGPENKRVNAVNDISLMIPKGKVTAIVGPNGSGKSTTLKLLSKITKPTTGFVRFNGAENSEKPKIGYMSGYSQLYKRLTVKENIEFIAKLNNSSCAEISIWISDWKARLGLSKILTKFPETLSEGQRQRVALACSLCFRPELIVLDEPTTGIDLVGTEVIHQILSDIKKTGTTLVLATHSVPEINALADTIYILKGGEITFNGTPDTLCPGKDDRKMAQKLTSFFVEEIAKCS